MQQYIPEIAIISICSILSFFFSGSETALFSLKKSDLHKFNSSMNSRERSVATIMQSPQNILITILTGNLFANMIMSSISTRILLDSYGEWGHIISIGILTPIVILFFEIAPKIIAINSNRTFSRRIISPLGIIHILLYPVRLMMGIVSNLVFRIFRLDHSAGKLSEDELDRAVEIAERDGAIDHEEGQFIKNVLKFPAKEASAVMFPRNMATFIPWGMKVDQAMDMFLEKGIIRAPVFKESLDNIIGVIDSRLLIPYYMKYKKAASINQFVRPVRFFPESRGLNDLLNDFLKERIQIAVLVDEYGGTAGVVTLNSILSELMGKDFTRWEAEQRPDIRKRGDRYSIISGEMRIDDFNETFNEELDSDNSDTMGGYLMEQLARIPKRGDELQTEKYILKIRYIKKNKVESIEVIQFDEDI